MNPKYYEIKFDNGSCKTGGLVIKVFTDNNQNNKIFDSIYRGLERVWGEAPDESSIKHILTDGTPIVKSSYSIEKISKQEIERKYSKKIPSIKNQFPITTNIISARNKRIFKNGMRIML
ncbi:MAG: hypothetical protein KKF48_04965 [Nanoarchaeota archaeon]|nr:hypothetical protein [Nanoarchaeota archaeon]MBU1028368.1 hypothetical protein [Nanoarchaeota archaeon]